MLKRFLLLTASAILALTVLSGCMDYTEDEYEEDTPQEDVSD